MKIMLLLDTLVFYDTEHEVVLKHIKDHALRHYTDKGKLFVQGTKQDLFYMLYVLSVDYDIELA